MATDMEFMNRIFHAALRRDLKRASNVLADANDHARPEQRVALAEHLGLGPRPAPPSPHRGGYGALAARATPRPRSWHAAGHHGGRARLRRRRDRFDPGGRAPVCDDDRVRMPSAAGCSWRSRNSVTCSCPIWTTKRPK